MLQRTIALSWQDDIMFEFTLIPEAVDAIPTSAWLTGVRLREQPPTRQELRIALRRAEARVSNLRAQLSPEM